jgi:purine-binding chemotaxis protein CheW
MVMNKYNTDTDEVTEDTQKGRYLTFIIDKETFGIEISYVMEIVGIQAITEMPEMPDYIKGIINLRGRIIPVMDVRIRFGKPIKEYDDRTCVIVIDFNGTSIGLVVDLVTEVLIIPDEEISDRPSLGTSDSRGYVKNIGKVNNMVILLVDCEKLLNAEEFNEIGESL